MVYSQLYCMKLNLNLAQIGLSLDSDRPGTHHFVSSRVALKKGLDISTVQSCLYSLDVFRDLLDGIPQQKNRVVRDVCKNIQLKHYQQKDLIYDIGDKSQSVFFCLSGEVSICIVKQIPKEANSQIIESNIKQNNDNANIQSARNINKMNLSKLNQSMVSLPSLALTSPSIRPQQQFELIEHQIISIESGQGFGQAQFISGVKRQVKAIAKTPNTFVGKLQVEHFAQVLQNYRARVYYKKRDMFQKCPLFANLPLNKLQFIINNTKPLTISISNKLVKEGGLVDTIFLVNKGQISLWKTGIQLTTDQSLHQQDNQQDQNNIKKTKSVIIVKKNSRQNSKKTVQSHLIKQQAEEVINEKESKIFEQFKNNKVYSSLFKLKAQKNPLPQQKHSKVFLGLLSEGCFLGDMQLATGKSFQFNAICRTETAQVYFCDKRIILSQMTEKNINQAKNYYNQKQIYISQRIEKYKCAKKKIIQQKQIDLLPPLTKQQIKIKRKIMRRHVQEKPSLIGSCSPGQIQKMILRKELRVKKQPQISRYPILQLFPNHSVKKRSLSPRMPSSFSPLSLVHSQNKKCITQYQQIQQKKITQFNPQIQNKIKQVQEKSILIKIKPTRINLSDIKYDQQKNMAIVGKILGRYRNCLGNFKNLNNVIQKMEKRRK